MKKKYGRHIKDFSVILGISYFFENQNLITFEDNFCYTRNLLFVAYWDFEMSTTTNGYVDYEMYPASLVLVLEFHSDLNFDRVSVRWSCCHRLNQLFDVSCILIYFP